MQNHFSLHHDSAVCQLCQDILHCPVTLPPTRQSCTSPKNSAPPQTEPCKAAPPLESAATWTWAHTTLVFVQRVILLLLNQIPFHSISLNSTRQKNPCWVLGRVSNTTTAWLRSLVISFLDRPKMLYSYPSRSPSAPRLYLASRCHGSQSMHALCTSCCCLLVAKSCPTLCNPMDCSLPGSSVHGILQARILEWVAIFFSRGSSQTLVSCIGRQILYHWTIMAYLTDFSHVLGSRVLRGWQTFIKFSL